MWACGQNRGVHACVGQVREVVYDFFASRYALCLARLQRLSPLLRLDMHLAPHLDALHAAVHAPSPLGCYSCHEHAPCMLPHEHMLDSALKLPTDALTTIPGAQQGADPVHGALRLCPAAHHGDRLRHGCRVS